MKNNRLDKRHINMAVKNYVIIDNHVLASGLNLQIKTDFRGNEEWLSSL